MKRSQTITLRIIREPWQNPPLVPGGRDAALYGNQGWPPLRVQVDRNRFIHALLTGTPLENHGYEYFGERAYERWIQGD